METAIILVVVLLVLVVGDVALVRAFKFKRRDRGR
jgi:hypothetical protein